MKKTSTILLLIFVIILGIGVYYLYNKYFKLQQSSTSNQKSVAVTSTATTPSPAKTTTKSSSPTTSATDSAVSGSWRDCAEFTAEETSTMRDWLTYTNDTYNYRFTYPHTWLVTTESPELVTVRGEDSGEEITFQVRVGRMTEIGFADYTLTFTRDFTINCLSAKENTYDGAGNLTMMAYTFNKSGNPYLLMYSYKDIGVSYAGDIYDLDKMILKSFAFRE